MKYLVVIFGILGVSILQSATADTIPAPGCNCVVHFNPQQVDRDSVAAMFSREIDSFRVATVQQASADIKTIKKRRYSTKMLHKDIEQRVNGRVYVWQWFFKVSKYDTTFSYVKIVRAK